MHFSNWQNKLSAVWLVILIVVAAGVACLWWNKDIHIQTNIFALLPEQHQDQELQKYQQYVNQRLNDQVFLVIDAPNDEALQKATATLAQQVSQSGLWQPLKAQVDTDQFAQTLYQHQAGLIAKEDIALLQQQDYAALTEQSLLQIMSPGLPVTADLLQRDPLLLFPRYAMQMAGQQSQSIEIEQGFATLRDQQGISRLFVLGLKQSPYNIDYQDKTAAWMAQLNQQFKALQVKPHWTGTLLFSTFGTQSAEKEISTIGVGSSLGVLLLVWFGFRSFRPMLTEFIAVSSGSLLAFAVTHWIFGEIHLMTLVFGASLIGVCVDFSFYFMALQSQHWQKDGFAVLKPVLPSLFMGLMTTLVAYIFLTMTPFPGFKQIAVFSIVGLSAAWLTSILLLPRLKALNAAPAIASLSFIGQWRTYFQSHQTLRIGMMIGIASISLISVFFLKSNDDIRNLQSMDQQLKQEDHYVRSRFGQQQGSDYFVITGKNLADVAQKEQALLLKLQHLQDAKVIQGFQAIGQTIPSVQQQQQNIARLQAIPKTALQAYAEAMQLDAGLVLNWQQQLSLQPLLDLAQFQQHPLAFLQPDAQHRLVLLQGIVNDQVVQQLQTSEIKLLQPVKSLSTLFQEHRIQAQYLLFYALITLTVVLTVIYGWSSIISLILPVSLALLSTFAVQAWLGVEINLFSIMGCFLIMGIGVDYAIFYRHGHDHPQVIGMALFLCMMSTLLGFGLLSFSQTYAIHCFGLTVLLGVIFSFIYATLLTRADPQHGLQEKNQSIG